MAFYLVGYFGSLTSSSSSQANPCFQYRNKNSQPPKSLLSSCSTGPECHPSQYYYYVENTIAMLRFISQEFRLYFRWYPERLFSSSPIWTHAPSVCKKDLIVAPQLPSQYHASHPLIAYKFFLFLSPGSSGKQYIGCYIATASLFALLF